MAQKGKIMTLEKWLAFTHDILEIIIWPLLIFIIFICLKDKITSFLGKLEEAEFAGIKLKAIPKDIKEAEEIKEKILIEPKKEEHVATIKRDNQINKRMIELGLEPSPSGLDLKYYYYLIQQDPNIALAGLRMDLEIMLKNLAKGFSISIDNKYSANKISELLLQKNAITQNQYSLMKVIMRICNAAIHGEKVTKEQATRILDIAPVLIDDYLSWLSWGFEQK